MINTIWFFIIFIGILFAFLSGDIDNVMNAAIKGGTSAIEITIGLTGVMCIWTGIMKIAEKSGLTKKLSKLLYPIIKLLFKDIPMNHSSIGAIVMNISSNVFGLSNAATPFGIKAIKELQALNSKKDTASNSMVMFLVINSACIQLIPASVISIRAAAGSKNPQEIIITTIISTLIAALFGIISCKILEHYY